MKKIFNFLPLIAIAILLLISCKKEHADTRYVTLNVTLARGTNYQLNLNQYGNAGSTAVISKQATDFTTSEIVNDLSSGYVYKYATATSPKVSSTGDDVVILKVTEQGNGRCNRHQNETDITINFTLQ